MDPLGYLACHWTLDAEECKGPWKRIILDGQGENMDPKWQVTVAEQLPEPKMVPKGDQDKPKRDTELTPNLQETNTKLVPNLHCGPAWPDPAKTLPVGQPDQTQPNPSLSFWTSLIRPSKPFRSAICLVYRLLQPNPSLPFWASLIRPSQTFPFEPA